MANIIYSLANENSEPLRMSNGSTSVLIAVLTLAGADLASTKWERDVLSWIATNDQSIFGIGCVGFDIAGLGWDQDSFDSQKKFLLDVVARGREQTGWEQLDYAPNENIVADMLSKFETLLQQFDISHCRNQALDWTLPPLDHPVRCITHGIYHHQKGCVICNDH